jgi:hypothetical protein
MAAKTSIRAERLPRTQKSPRRRATAKGVWRSHPAKHIRSAPNAGRVRPTSPESRRYLFKEQLIYEQSTSRGVHELREKRTCGWSGQPPTA